MDFAIPTGHKEKIKESDKTNKYLNINKELKKTMANEADGGTNCNWSSWNSSQILEVFEKIQTILTTAYLISATILSWVQNTKEDLMLFRLQWKNHLLTVV